MEDWSREDLCREIKEEVAISRLSVDDQTEKQKAVIVCDISLYSDVSRFCFVSLFLMRKVRRG